ncbi:High mobility group protein 20A [Blomia tropicalis]|nr:High mobility group protein 20A [Blomia tropicalis]
MSSDCSHSSSSDDDDDTEPCSNSSLEYKLNKRKYTRRKQPEERKKRGPRTKDINAPRMPLNGYVRFLNANRERIKKSYPTLSFAEVTKKLASEWSSMSSDEKKAYLDEAERAKEMYLKELQEYQKTDSYQEFLNMKQQFLEHNKMREQELRNYRALTTEYEEENAILSKHVDDMTSATERLIQDETKERETNGRLKAVFEMLQQNIVEQFHDVELPQTYWPANYCEQNASSGTISEHGMSDSADSTTQSYRANMDNIDQFMYGLDHFAQSYNGNAAMSGENNSTTFNTCKGKQLVQSIQTAISAMDEVTF